MKRAAAAPPSTLSDASAVGENVSRGHNSPIVPQRSKAAKPPIPETIQYGGDQARVQFFEQVFQASPDGLSIADNNHTVQWANDTFVRMFGYSQAEVIGQQLESLVVPLERQAESHWASEALAKGDQITLETQRRKKDGNLLDVRLSCAPMRLDGKICGFYAGYHDISDRRRVEALSSALYRVAEKSSSAHDLQQFFAAVHSIVDELMYARNFYIAIYDPATELLSFPYFVDEQDTAPAPKKWDAASPTTSSAPESRCWPRRRCWRRWRIAAK